MSATFNDERFAIEGVLPEHLPAVWGRCWPLIARVAARNRVAEPWTSDGLFAEIASRKAQLWIAWSHAEKTVVAAIVTMIKDRPPEAPDAKVCLVPLIAGDGMSEWGPMMWRLLNAWAASLDCTLIAGFGRLGWKRLYGFRVAGRTEDGLPILVREVERA